MDDTSLIHQLIARARRRLRLQAAFESATTASIVAIACALAAVYAIRREVVDETVGIGLLVGSLVIVGLGALLGALGRFPTHVVATRIDRASNLSDRLSSACYFEDKLDEPHDPDTQAFMRAAIRDAVASVPRANIVAATPFHNPRDSRAAVLFGVVALLVAGLYWPQGSIAGTPNGRDIAPLIDEPERPEKRDRFEEEDLDYTRDLLDDLRQMAKTEREPHLEEFVQDVENLLAKAELGELSKERLLEELTRAEQRYMEGAEENQVEESMSALKETGRELKKDALTREIGKALEKGDLEKAQKEMEKLADKLDKNELSEKDKEKAAKALEKAAEKFEKKEQQKDKKLDQQIAKKQEQMRKMQRKLDKEKNPQKKERLARQLDDKKRELKKLQRKKEQREQSEQRRTLKRLHRNMKQASQDMRQPDPQKQRQASRKMRYAARDTGKVQADRRKVATQKKVASQLSDLKEAMRRARRRGNKGPRDMFGKNRRNQDFQRRARGQQGSRGAWRPGQTGKGGQKGQQGQKGQGNQPGGKGKQPGGKSYGDQHDPYVTGDATAKSGRTRDENVSGVQGRGPSTRETILSAAQKGFSSQSYKKVYTDYKEIVEEVIRSEKVPSGYKHYVKKYFHKIKPHSMD